MPADRLRPLLPALELLLDLLDLLLPARCAACPSPARLLCPRCRSGLTGAPDLRVLPGGLVVALAGPYAGPARAALLAHKERGRLGLAGPLGAALAVAVTALDLPPPLVLVPVPSARSAVRARGHDHARRLAASAARALAASGQPARTAALLRQARVPADQAGLDAGQRARNLAGALRARPAPGGSVVVVDDVVTTGATLDEAARALAAAGTPAAGGAVVAGTVRRSVARSPWVSAGSRRAVSLH